MCSLRALLSLSVFVATMLASCSIEKRVHMPGYHVEWVSGKNNRSGLDLESARRGHTPQEDRVLPERSAVGSAAFNTTEEQTSADTDEVFASTENVAIPSAVKSNFADPAMDSHVVHIDHDRTEGAKRAEVRATKKEVISALKSSNSSSGGSGALRAIGWVVLIIGLLFLLFISILLGALLMILGLIFVLAGGSKDASSSQSKGKSEYIDVVYLKNGSMIKGMIIEQTPNVSIKIQTRDGSVFVYQMDEVEKITKELSK